MALADFQARGERGDIAFVQSAALDQLERAGDGGRSATPGIEVRRAFRTATQAGAEAGLLRRRSGRDEETILELRRARRTDGTAVDARRFDAGEKASVIAG